MNATNEALIYLIAATDAAWMPSHDAAEASGRWHAQKEYLAGGVRWDGKSTATAEGQQARKLLGKLESAGLVVVTRGGKGKPTLVRLTEKGRERARKAAGVPSLAESRKFLRDAEALYARLRKRDKYRDCQGGHQVKEAELVKELGCDAKRVELLAAPALERGWLKTATAGVAVAYYITAAGQAELALAGTT